MDDLYLDSPYQLAGRSIDPVSGTVSYKGQHSSLSRKQLEVLALLASQDRAVLREELIRQVWDGDKLVGEKGLTNAVYALRRSLQDTDAKQRLIRTIPRRGYQLHAEVAIVRGEQDPSFVEGWPIPGRPGWQLQRLISQSDSSETWRARHLQTQERRIFRFCRSEQYLRLLRREVDVLRFLRERLAEHRESFAGIVDWRLDDPPYFLEMEATVHGSLADWSAARGGLGSMALGERLRLLCQAAEALHTLHGLGVFHRNITPASVLIDEGRGRPVAKLGELSLCHVTQETNGPEAPMPGTASGTLAPGEIDSDSPYAPPEHRAGQLPEAAGDVYAFGVLLFEVAVGDWHRALSAESLQTVHSPDLRQIIAACVTEQPQERPTAEQLSQQLQSSFVRVAEYESGVATLPELAVPRLVLDEPGQSIGPYRLLEVLGEGGMGTVYLARQRQPVERRVALKLIKAGLDSEHVLARFEAERQALALMDHDNVAAVHDAGSSSGRPYFVMEYVPGLDLTAHCDHLQLRLRARIELFLQVCHGVQHAHQKGLIHRDLKPGNILVKKHASQPATVKIIDFGVAKSLQGKLGADTVHTRLGTFVGTPRYSSPEQISDHLPDVDTRSDVYSLGVVLYELVTGVTPRSAEELAGKSSGELAKILEKDPPTPHSRFSRLDPEQKAEIAGSRSRSIAELEQRLHADLSWIILKCLERDPDDRYASVLELKKDLERWLDDQPVEARPSTGIYRVAKFVRRHRTAVAAAATVTALLLTTTSAAVVGFLRAEQEAEKARDAAHEAEMAADFQVRQLQDIDASAIAAGIRTSLRAAVEEQSRKRESNAVDEDRQQFDRLLQGVNFTDLTLKQFDPYFFEPALRNIDTSYDEFPLLQARMWQATAATLQRWGKLELAVEPQERALERRLTLLGSDDPLTLESLHYRGDLRLDLGRLEEAETDLRTAVAGFRRSLGDQAAQTLAAINSLGLAQLNQSVLDEAEAHLREALEGRRIVLGHDHPDTLQSLHNLGNLFMQAGQLEKAEGYLREALEGRREVLGDNHLQTVQSLDAIATVLHYQFKIQEAEEHYRQALEGFHRLLGVEHRSTLIARGNLAAVLANAGQTVEAERLHLELVATNRRILGHEHPDTLSSIANFATLLQRTGRHAEAERYLREAVRGRSRTLGEDHPDTLIAVNNLATALRTLGQLVEAEMLARQTVEDFGKTFGKEHLFTLRCVESLGRVLFAQGRLAEAEILLREANESMREQLGDEHPDTLRSSSILAELLEARGKLDQAEMRG